MACLNNFDVESLLLITTTNTPATSSSRLRLVFLYTSDPGYFSPTAAPWHDPPGPLPSIAYVTSEVRKSSLTATCTRL